MSLSNLQGKVIMITGASSGIGRACAICVSKAGGSVIATGRDADRLRDTNSRLTGGKHHFFTQDLSDFSMTEKNISDAVENLGKISGFVHAAGIEQPLPFRQLTPDHYRNILNINVIAGFEIARVISHKKFLSDSGASIIFISSVMALLGEPGLVSYCSSKAALVAGARAMALELAPKKIRVNSVLPGVVEDTEMTRNLFRILPDEAVKEVIRKHPLGLGRTDDVAHLCVFLLSDLARWLTGADIIIDGGYSAH